LSQSSESNLALYFFVSLRHHDELCDGVWGVKLARSLMLGQHQKSPFLLLGFGRVFNRREAERVIAAPIDHPFEHKLANI